MFDPRTLRLTVVTSGTLDAGRSHRAIAIAALAGGATTVQLRAPELDDAALLPLAVDLAARCRAAGVRLIVNDRLGIAIESGADGVHLGQADDPARARDRLGPDAILGISVSGAEEARAAVSMGADYVGMTVWATRTKPEAIGRGPAGIREVCGTVSIPVVGIGGIDRRNLGEVLEAGASGIAVISAVAAASDPVQATRDLRTLIDHWEASGGPAHR